MANLDPSGTYGFVSNVEAISVEGAEKTAGTPTIATDWSSVFARTLSTL
jgi:hypothetical protein